MLVGVASFQRCVELHHRQSPNPTVPLSCWPSMLVMYCRLMLYAGNPHAGTISELLGAYGEAALLQMTIDIFVRPLQILNQLLDGLQRLKATGNSCHTGAKHLLTSIKHYYTITPTVAEAIFPRRITVSSLC